MPAVTLEKKSKKGAIVTFLCVLIVLAAVIVLENVLDPNRNLIVFTPSRRARCTPSSPSA